MFSGAPVGIRTPNLLIRSQMLYPLSYGRVLFSCTPPSETAVPRRREDLNLRSRFKRDNSLAVSPIRPLWHASQRSPFELPKQKITHSPGREANR